MEPFNNYAGPIPEVKNSLHCLMVGKILFTGKS